MEDLKFEELDFTLGWCAICGRDVLTSADYDEDGQERRRCVHCDELVQNRLRGTKGELLPTHGYGLLETQGCGSPSCGGGQCGRRQNDPE